MPPMAIASNGGATETATASVSGFRYTPPSYLLRTREENRPWTSAVNGIDEDDLGVMPQEQRPPKMQTNLDAHFQQRVRQSKNRYRNILKGDQRDGVVADDDAVVEEEDHEQVVLRAEMSGSSGSSSTTSSSSLLHLRSSMASNGSGNNGLSIASPSSSASSPLSAQQAREARKQRLSGSTTTGGSSSTASASGDVVFGRNSSSSIHAAPSSDHESTARSLRAQRLRGSFRQTLDEVDVQTKMEMRRLEETKQDRLLQLEEASQKRAQEQQVATMQEERMRLQRERNELEQAKREAAFALAHQVRTQQLREASQVKKKSLLLKKKQAKSSKNGKDGGGDSEDSSTEDSLDSMMNTNTGAKKKSMASLSSRGARLRALRKKGLVPSNGPRSLGSTKTRGTADTAAAAADGQADFAFVDDMTQMLRDSGLLTGCVAQCFGGDQQDLSTGSMRKTRKAPAVATSSSSDDSSAEVAARNARRQKMNVYAQYRE